MGWHRATPLRGRYVIFLLSYTAFWALLCVSVLTEQRWWRWPAAAAAALWIASGASVATDLFLDHGREGVVLVDEVVVRKGNSEGFEPQIEEPLHQGVEFSVVEERAGWLSIELPNGKTGWIRAADAGLIG